MKALQYSLDEALASLWRGRHSGLLSTATIALALFVLGAFLLVTTNLDRLGAEWSRSAELSVYLTDDVTLDQRRAIEGALAPGDLIASREYVSKSDALSRFKQTFGDLASTIDGLGDNPLPASIEVRLRPDAGASASVDALSARLRGMPGVADVRYDRQWLNRLLAAVGVIRGVGVALAAILTFAAALTVANVVRLGLYARRDETGDHAAGRCAPGLHSRSVRHGRRAAGRSGRPRRPDPARRPVFALRARYLTPLASALSLSSLHFLPVGLCFLVVLGGWRSGAWAVWSRPVLRNLDSGFTAALHSILNNDNSSRGPACHASSPIRGRSARSTLSQSSTGKNLSNTTAVYSSSAYYSESAITDVEAALTKILAQLEQLSTQDNAPQVVSSLLRKFDVVTGLSAWSDPKQSH